MLGACLGRWIPERLVSSLESVAHYLMARTIRISSKDRSGLIDLSRDYTSIGSVGVGNVRSKIIKDNVGVETTVQVIPVDLTVVDLALRI